MKHFLIFILLELIVYLFFNNIPLIQVVIGATFAIVVICLLFSLGLREENEFYE